MTNKKRQRLIIPLLVIVVGCAAGCSTGSASAPATKHPTTGATAGAAASAPSASARKIDPVVTYTNTLEIAALTFGDLLDYGRNNLSPQQRDVVRPYVQVIESSLTTTRSALRSYVLSRDEGRKIEFLSSLLDVETRIAELAKQVYTLKKEKEETR